MNAKPTASFDALGLPPVLVETMTGLAASRGRQSPTVRLPCSCQNWSA